MQSAPKSSGRGARRLCLPVGLCCLSPSFITASDRGLSELACRGDCAGGYDVLR